MIAREIIKRAFRIMGTLASGESLKASEENDALEARNDMLRTWTTQKFLRPAEIRMSFTVLPDQSEYTIGEDPSLSFTHLDLPKPLKVNTAFLRNNDFIDTPLIVVVSPGEINA